MKKIEKTIELGGRKLTLSTGYLAPQAGGAVLATYEETVVLATITSKPLDRDLDYFPLTVDYQEKLYAGGRIKGSKWIKREGKPTDEEILTSRLIDRSLRPLFYKSFKEDVQVIAMVLSVDKENSPEIISAIAASAAVSISSIPWGGPVGVVQVGLSEGKFITNPKISDLQKSDLDLIVSATNESVVMIESGSNNVSEEIMIKGIEHAQKETEKIVKFIESFAKEVGVKKEKYVETKYPESLIKRVKELVEKRLDEVVTDLVDKESGRSFLYDEITKAVVEEVSEKERSYVPAIMEELRKKHIRSMILKGKRPDKRKNDEIRALSAFVGVLPRTHGSAIFQRGMTQVLSIATLGAPSLELLIESAEGEESKRYMHHYSMPPFSTGETGKIGSPSRREIGHGALAERALLPVIPSQDEFPYTIRVVSEVLSSNGSTSMASTCGSTLSLLDAGVPLKALVSGIAMGLVIEDSKNYAILTDILGLEDFNGDMDFKVAGTKVGINALQLDVKTLKLSLSILKEALKQANKARLEVLAVMEKAIAKPRETVSKYAPKIKIVRIDPAKIGELIGPGGKKIKAISEATGCQIDVNEDGSVFVSGVTEEELKNGIAQVESVTKVPVAGEVYEGTVKRVQPFGAFVEIWPGKEGMVHVSDMSENYVRDANDILKVDQKIQVRVKGIDNLGRLNLSMMMDPAFDIRKEERQKQERRGGDRDRGGGREHFSRAGRGWDRRGDRRQGIGGPHFPTSRLLSEKEKRF